jgi:molecular chaperone GrpE
MTGNDHPTGDADRRELEPIPGETQESFDADFERAHPPAAASDNVSELHAQIAEANERALRSHAELENFRKRARREMDDERRYAALPLIRDLLQVVDNLQRAVESAGGADASTGLLDGVKMVSQQLLATLSQYSCKRIEAIGQPFDPNLHEAVGQEPTAEFPAGSVSRELRGGYLLHDRVVRPSQVFVAAPPPS